MLPVARHLEAPDFMQNVLESVAVELDLRPPRRPSLRPFKLEGFIVISTLCLCLSCCLLLV